MLTSSLIYGFSILRGISASRGCLAPDYPQSLPSCTDQCLAGDSSVFDGTCGDDLRGLCNLSIDAYLVQFQDCLMKACPQDEDRYAFIENVESACANDIHPLTTVSGYFGSYFTRDSTTSSGTEPSTTTITSTSTSTIFDSTSENAAVPSTSSSRSPLATPFSSVPAPTSQSSSTPQPPSTTSFAGPAPTKPPSAETEHSSATTAISHSLSTSTGSPSATGEPHSSNENAGPSTAQIALIAVGATLGVGFAIAAVLYFLRRRTQPRKDNARYIATQTSEDEPKHGGGDEKAELHAQATAPQPCMSMHQHPLSPTPLEISELCGGMSGSGRYPRTPVLPGVSELGGGHELRDCLERPGDGGRSF